MTVPLSIEPLWNLISPPHTPATTLEANVASEVLLRSPYILFGTALSPLFVNPTNQCPARTCHPEPKELWPFSMSVLLPPLWYVSGEEKN